MTGHHSTVYRHKIPPRGGGSNFQKKKHYITFEWHSQHVITTVALYKVLDKKYLLPNEQSLLCGLDTGKGS